MNQQASRLTFYGISNDIHEYSASFLITKDIFSLCEAMCHKAKSEVYRRHIKALTFHGKEHLPTTALERRVAPLQCIERLTLGGELSHMMPAFIHSSFFSIRTLRIDHDASQLDAIKLAMEGGMFPGLTTLHEAGRLHQGPDSTPILRALTAPTVCPLLTGLHLEGLVEHDGAEALDTCFRQRWALRNPPAYLVNLHLSRVRPEGISAIVNAIGSGVLCQLREICVVGASTSMTTLFFSLCDGDALPHLHSVTLLHGKITLPDQLNASSFAERVAAKLKWLDLPFHTDATLRDALVHACAPSWPTTRQPSFTGQACGAVARAIRDGRLCPRRMLSFTDTTSDEMRHFAEALVTNNTFAHGLENIKIETTSAYGVFTGINRMKYGLLACDKLREIELCESGTDASLTLESSKSCPGLSHVKHLYCNEATKGHLEHLAVVMKDFSAHLESIDIALDESESFENMTHLGEWLRRCVSLKSLKVEISFLETKLIAHSVQGGYTNIKSIDLVGASDDSLMGIIHHLTSFSLEDICLKSFTHTSMESWFFESLVKDVSLVTGCHASSSGALHLKMEGGKSLNIRGFDKLECEDIASMFDDSEGCDNLGELVVKHIHPPREGLPADYLWQSIADYGRYASLHTLSISGFRVTDGGFPALLKVVSGNAPCAPTLKNLYLGDLAPAQMCQVLRALQSTTLGALEYLTLEGIRDDECLDLLCSLLKDYTTVNSLVRLTLIDPLEGWDVSIAEAIEAAKKKDGRLNVLYTVDPDSELVRAALLQLSE